MDLTYFREDTIGKIIVQAIGIVAMALTILCYQLKQRKYILLMQYSGNLLWVVHYFLLGSTTAVVMNALNVFRGIIYSLDKKWAKSKIWIFVFLALSISLGIITFNEWYSILPIIGTAIATVALRINDENTLRKVYITSVPPWIVYNALANSLPGTISATFTLVSLVVALFRYKGFKKDKPKN